MCFCSGVESGGAPWSTNSYDVRPTDTAGLQAEGGPAGPYTCDTDGFACSVFNSQAFDNGVVPTMPMLDKDASAAMRAHHNAMAYQLYTNFGVGAESSHPRIGPGSSSGDMDTSGLPCALVLLSPAPCLKLSVHRILGKCPCPRACLGVSVQGFPCLAA